MDSDDESLPEVSFDSSPRRSDAEEPVPSPPRNYSYTSELAKITAYCKKIEENYKFETNKAELEDLIRQDGFQFDEGARLRQIPTDDKEENLELNEGQRHILNQLNKGNEDPIIAFKPELDNLFDLKSCRIVFNEYPIEAFTHTFAASLNHPNLIHSNIISQVSQVVEQSFFFKFFNQVPSEANKKAVLDCLFFNIPWFTSNLKALAACEILSEIINTQRLSPAEAQWRIDGNMLYKYLKSLGFKSQKLEACLPNLFLGIQGINKSTSETSSIGRFVVELQEMEAIDEENFKIAIKCLLDLLYLSLRLGPNGESFYSTAELDLMFVVLAYLFLDDNFDLEFSTDHRLVLQLLLGNYPDAQWDPVNDKSKALCSYVFKSYGLDTPEDEEEMQDMSEQFVLADKSATSDAPSLSQNVLYHRIYHFISSLGFSADKKANKFRFDLAYYSACNLLISYSMPDEQMNVSDDGSSSEEDNDKTLLNVRKHPADNYLDYKHLASMAKEKLSQIYMSSTYAMYNLVRLLDIVIADIAMSPTDGELKMKVLEELKEAVQSSNRCAKDKLEFQGRMQVKIMNSNFITKCDYYLKEFTQKSSNYANLILNENKHRRLSRRGSD